MVAIEAWYDGDADEPAILRTVDDLDALLDRMASDGLGFAVPPLAELTRNDDGAWVVAYIGIDAKNDLGVITYSDRDGSVISSNGRTDGDVVDYDYMGHLRELPASAEIPLAEVRRAVREFIAVDSARPTSVVWQVSG
ncbi:MAG TPA: Imm1 family immunity protein [Pseudonocardiaceae bacterium]|nr:Imm1 family immunity protein [Pseudonocardiaceae bacterium]